ncbi:MAG: acyl carrier protein [Lachnospiraceae bacterium]|nr:acyl carrier protein [Lachnospiraceae bacterium]
MEWDKIRSIVAEELQIRAEEIHMDSRFSEDLGADSLNVYRIITEIEDVFSVEVSDAFSDYNPQTVGALYNRVSELLGLVY